MRRLGETRPTRGDEGGTDPISGFRDYVTREAQRALIFALATGRCSAAQEARAREHRAAALRALDRPTNRGGGIVTAARYLRLLRAELGVEAPRR